MTLHGRTPRPAGAWRNWVQAWVGFWFSTTTAVPLAVCRLVLVPGWLLFFGSSWELHSIPLGYDPARINQTLMHAVLLFVPVETFHTWEFLRGLWLVTTVAGVLATVGFFTRTSLLTFGLGNVILIAHRYSYGELHHPEALYCIAIVLIALSPAGRCYSVDSWIGKRSRNPEGWGPDAKMDTAMWALRLVQCLLGLAYFSAGSGKLLYGGLAWMNGATMQTIVLTDYVRFGMPAGLWLVESFWLSVAGSVTTILVEVSFFLAVFVPPMRKYILMAGVGLHVGIYVTMAAPFFIWMAMYAVFVDFESLRRWVVLRNQARHRQAPPLREAPLAGGGS